MNARNFMAVFFSNLNIFLKEKCMFKIIDYKQNGAKLKKKRK